MFVSAKDMSGWCNRNGIIGEGNCHTVGGIGGGIGVRILKTRSNCTMYYLVNHSSIFYGHPKNKKKKEKM